MLLIKPDLRILVTSQAILSSVTQHLQREVINENIIVDKIHITNTDIRCFILYACLLTISFYGELQFTNYVEPKLRDFTQYTIVKKLTNSFIFILCIILTRSVQPAM